MTGDTPVSEKGLKLGKRLSGLAATGALPAAIIGLIGDLLTPKGGWMVVGGVGLVAAAIAVYLIASLSGRDSTSSVPWWYGIFKRDADLSWIWDGNPFGAHGVHVVVLFAAACLFCAHKSFASGAEGGVMAKNVSAVAVAQRQLGVSTSTLEEQRRTTKVLSEINQKAENFKREASDDPRKELANSGVPWDHGRLTQAISQQDLRTVGLFLKGGMPMNQFDALEAFNGRSAVIREAVAGQAAELFDPQGCTGLLSRLGPDRVATAANELSNFVKKLCANTTGRAVVEQEAARWRAVYDAELEAGRKIQASRRSAGDCVRDELRGGGRPLMNEVANFNVLNVSTLSPRQEMLAELQAGLRVGHDEVEAKVRAFCDAQSRVSPVATDGTQRKKWETLRDWLS